MSGDADERAVWDQDRRCGDPEPEEAPEAEPLCDWCGRWVTDATVCRACLLGAPLDAGEIA